VIDTLCPLPNGKEVNVMTYQTPELRLVGAAQGIVLGHATQGPHQYPDNGIGEFVSRSTMLS
jgi:hypothetical protein